MNNKNEYDLSDLEKKVLTFIQSDFPISSRPYAEIARRLNIEDEYLVFEIVLNLKEKGIIRRIGPNFNSFKLGYTSTLCTAKVLDNTLNLFVSVVNSYVGVTHNYLREHEYNIWFTLIAKSEQEITDILTEITEKTGVAILNLPAKKLYKIKVDFKL